MDKKRTLALQLIIAIGFSGVSLGHIYKAVKSHEMLWIVIASIEALCFLGAAAFIFYSIIKNNKQAA
jgi:hypothetical protein